MENIYNTNDKFDHFDFSKMEMTKPSPMVGGNHFIRFLVNDGQHIYVQPPTCVSKQGIVKVGKRYYSDLMFTNEHEHFIRWLENLETYCHSYIYNNREKWFDNDMEMHDIENYFTSPIKLYKSGTYYAVRSNIQTILDKPKLKIYNEDGIEIDSNKINNNTQLMTILEIQGIRCSPRSFQIDIEIKQIMALKPNNMFENCLFKPVTVNDNTRDKPNIETSDNNEPVTVSVENTNILVNSVSDDHQILEDTTNNDITEQIEKDDDCLAISINTESHVTENIIMGTDVCVADTEDIIIETDKTNASSIVSNEDDTLTTSEKNIENIINEPAETNEMQEVVFNLEELPENEQITLKRRNEVYYEMYREARQKAKAARNLALSSYLEAKNIKNKYMLDDIEDSDESDLENDD